MRISGRQASLDAPFVAGEEHNLHEVLEDNQTEKPDSELMVESLKWEILHALSKLTKRESEVITLYFGLNGEQAMTLEDIGSFLGLTSERVRQIQDKATRRIRQGTRSKVLKAYLG